MTTHSIPAPVHQDDFFGKRLKSVFLSDHVKCAATLHLPEGDDLKGLTAILMMHGWGGIQGALDEPFIRCFAKAGFAVLTFDYPGWGHSEGLPRNDINPWKRVSCADSALAHLKSMPEVDATRVVLWGTSFGGGHAIELASEHPELLGAIAQVPMLDGRDSVKATPLPRLVRLGMNAIVDSLSPKNRVYIPVVAPAGQFGSMDRDGAHESLLKGIDQSRSRYDNRVAARSLLTMGLYRPIKRLKNIRIPTLLIGASRDSVAPFIESKLQSMNVSFITLRTLDANHFEPYFEPVLSKNLALQLEFLESITDKQEGVGGSSTKR